MAGRNLQAQVDRGLQLVSTLLERETRAVEQLTVAIDVYFKPMMMSRLLTHEELFAVFCNIIELRDAQRELAKRLRSVLTAAAVAQNPQAAGSQKPIHTRQLSLGAGGGSAHASAGPATPASPAVHQRAESYTNEKVLVLQDSAAGRVPPESYIEDIVRILTSGGSSSADKKDGSAGSAPPDPCMLGFIAQHMMYVANFNRKAVPFLRSVSQREALLSSASPSKKAELTKKRTPLQERIDALIELAAQASHTVSITDTLLPENDPMSVDRAHRSPVEILLVLLGTPLPSLLRYTHTARCLLGLSEIPLPKTLRSDLTAFIARASQEHFDEARLAVEFVATAESEELISRMYDLGDSFVPRDRSLVHFGYVIKKFRRGRHERLMFLFSDVLCYVEEEEGKSRLRVRGTIRLDATPPPTVESVEDSYFLQLLNCFEIHDHAEKEKYVFFAASALEKERWMEAIKHRIGRAQTTRGCPITELPLSGQRIVRKCGPTSRLELQRQNDKREFGRAHNDGRLSGVASVRSVGSGDDGGRHYRTASSISQDAFGDAVSGGGLVAAGTTEKHVFGGFVASELTSAAASSRSLPRAATAGGASGGNLALGYGSGAAIGQGSMLVDEGSASSSKPGSAKEQETRVASLQSPSTSLFTANQPQSTPAQPPPQSTPTPTGTVQHFDPFADHLQASTQATPTPLGGTRIDGISPAPQYSGNASFAPPPPVTISVVPPLQPPAPLPMTRSMGPSGSGSLSSRMLSLNDLRQSGQTTSSSMESATGAASGSAAGGGGGELSHSTSLFVPPSPSSMDYPPVSPNSGGGNPEGMAKPPPRILFQPGGPDTPISVGVANGSLASDSPPLLLATLGGGGTGSAGMDLNYSPVEVSTPQQQNRPAASGTAAPTAAPPPALISVPSMPNPMDDLFAAD